LEVGKKDSPETYKEDRGKGKEEDLPRKPKGRKPRIGICTSTKILNIEIYKKHCDLASPTSQEGGKDDRLVYR